MRGLGNLQGAAGHYETAESIYRQVCHGYHTEYMQNKCDIEFWHVLRDHADVLRHLGQPSVADSLEKEAAGIVVKSGPPE
jgi:hypothetical protein